MYLLLESNGSLSYRIWDEISLSTLNRDVFTVEKGIREGELEYSYMVV